MDIFAIAVLCIVSAITAKVIQPSNADIAAVISVAGVCIVAFMILDPAGKLFLQLYNTVEGFGINTGYIVVAVKSIGVCYICEISSSCCRDCGETALGGIIDISGRIAIGIMTLPLITELISYAGDILFS